AGSFGVIRNSHVSACTVETQSIADLTCSASRIAAHGTILSARGGICGCRVSGGLIELQINRKVFLYVESRQQDRSILAQSASARVKHSDTVNALVGFAELANLDGGTGRAG